MAKVAKIGDVPGNVLGMLADLNHKLRYGKITPKQLERFLRKEDPFSAAAYAKDSVLTLNVDRGRSFQESIATRIYCSVDGDVRNRDFQFTGTGNVPTNIVFVYFNEKVRIERVFKEMQKRHVRPADIQELLAIGQQRPQLHRLFSIAALGTVWKEGRYEWAPCLHGHENKTPEDYKINPGSLPWLSSVALCDSFLSHWCFAAVEQ